MLLLKPYLGCNIACKYCYEGNLRKKDRPKMKYNLEAIFKRMEEFKDERMAFHGGEPLSLPKKDVEAILAKMHELKGRGSIQTNATFIDDGFIEMFKKYNTHVGISWDGPGELSKYRPGTSGVGSTIERLVKEKVPTSVIMVISKANAGTSQLFKKLKKYILELNQMKIHGRLNPCYGAPKYELPIEKLKEIYLDLADFCLRHNLRWSPFIDIINGLQNKDRVCTFMGCDPFFTTSATVILGDDSITNCMRTNQEGVLLRDSKQYKTRNEILENVSQKYGGCKGCKYWVACYGGCPSGAIDNDWRNRTYLCLVWKGLFEFYEKILSHCGVPIATCQTSQGSSAQQRPPEEELVEIRPGVKHKDHSDSKSTGPHGDAPHGDHMDSKPTPEHKDGPEGDKQRPPEEGLVEIRPGVKHGDHSDSKSTRPHEDAPHGDAPHGDAPHGDHGDTKLEQKPPAAPHGDAPHGDHMDHKDSE